MLQCRVLEFAGRHSTALAGRIAATHGADVVLVEPHEGSRSRNQAPRENGRSIPFTHYNAGKRAVTLDPTSSRAVDARDALVESSDVVLTAGDEWHGLDVSYLTLCADRTDLVVATVSSFPDDVTDEYADDLLLQAAAGVMSHVGDPNRKPLKIDPWQAVQFAGLVTFNGILSAHYHRATGGDGQHVTVSEFEAVASILPHELSYYTYADVVNKRSGQKFNPEFAPLPGMYETRDGYICVGIGSEAHARAFFRAVDLDDLAESDLLADPYDNRRGHAEEFLPDLESRLKTLDKAEVERRGQEEGVPLFQVAGPQELLDDDHLAAKEMFVKRAEAGLGDVVDTRDDLHLDIDDTDQLKSAPDVDADSHPVYTDLGFTDTEITAITGGE